MWLSYNPEKRESNRQIRLGCCIFGCKVMAVGIYAEKNRRTRQQIQNAFLQLLEEKPFESVTVGDIAKAARINRGTFYLHYTDKFDLLDRMEQQLFADLGRHIDSLQTSYLSAQTFEEGQEQLAEALFDFIQMHARILKILFSDHGRGGFHIRFRDAFAEKVRINLERDERFHARLKAPLEYFLAFVTSAFLGLMEQWVKNDFHPSSREMTVIYHDIIQFIRNG